MTGRKVTFGEEKVAPEPQEQNEQEAVIEEATPIEDQSEEEPEEEYDSRKMDPEEELWEGGPRFKHINAWKDNHGDVYVTTVAPDTHYVWRPITRHEYRNIIQLAEQQVSQGAITRAQANLDTEESITETCVLFPEYRRADNAFVYAGVPSTLSQHILEGSNFGSLDVRQL